MIDLEKIKEEILKMMKFFDKKEINCTFGIDSFGWLNYIGGRGYSTLGYLEVKFNYKGEIEIDKNYDGKKVLWIDNNIHTVFETFHEILKEKTIIKIDQIIRKRVLDENGLGFIDV